MAIDGMDSRVHSIEFRNVGFAYKGGQTVLSDFNLFVRAENRSRSSVRPAAEKRRSSGWPAGSMSQLRAKSSSTASTTASVRCTWLQSNLGMVLQQPYLFSGTVMENIRYGRLTATDEEIIQAAKLTEAHEFIELLKDGYNATVGEGGNQLPPARSS